MCALRVLPCELSHQRPRRGQKKERGPWEGELVLSKTAPMEGALGSSAMVGRADEDAPEDAPAI
jgi:hypothetical protein